MKLLGRISFYLLLSFLIFVHVFTVSAKPTGYIEITLFLLSLFFFVTLLFVFLLKISGKSYKNIGITLSTLPFVTIILNSIPRKVKMGASDGYDEITFVTVSPIVAQGIAFYSLNILVFLIGLIIYIYQVRARK